MSDPDEEISYLALQKGTPVLSASGTAFGTVEHVLQVPQLDVFDGIVVHVHRGLRFVDREQIDKITSSAVYSSLSDDDVAQLPPPSGTPVERVDAFADTGPSLSARLGRMFGRKHWLKEEDDG